ncbi:thiamine-phosphate synthase [Hydrogenophilus thermoluteolus]|uniref:thiamine phosphate synthase n=1 Tax=Hydrogenophilus thermoluteolus TaxID=297 RepID=UPI00249FAB5A|nr:thiamine phosphate synthase [Hydrogenophilus thermoluteolus]GLW60270.1 thiamine-phosphate synthase [Hydrogenophilus thermoluteolus]
MTAFARHATARPFWYLITPDDPDGAQWRARVAAALEARPDWVQYRNKAATLSERQKEAEWLCARAAAAGVAVVVINDDWRLAQSLGVGVHLGQGDGSLTEARQRLGPQAVIGASCYASRLRAEAAVAEGASYVAFGAVFLSQTKPGAQTAPLSLFAATRALGVLRVAIGGVTLARVPELLAAGVDGVAVIADLFAQPSLSAVAVRAAAWREAFDRWQCDCPSQQIEPKRGAEDGCQ